MSGAALRDLEDWEDTFRMGAPSPPTCCCCGCLLACGEDGACVECDREWQEINR